MHNLPGYPLHQIVVREGTFAMASVGMSATHVLRDPIRWSEDFGLFTQVSKGALLGLGSGSNHSALHSPDYDFPDSLIPTGVALFSRIVEQLLGQDRA